MRAKHHARTRHDDSKRRAGRRATDLISGIDDSHARVYISHGFIRNLYNLSARDSIYNAFCRPARDLKVSCNVTSRSPSARKSGTSPFRGIIKCVSTETIDRRSRQSRETRQPASLGAFVTERKKRIPRGNVNANSKLPRGERATRALNEPCECCGKARETIS